MEQFLVIIYCYLIRPLKNRKENENGEQQDLPEATPDLHQDEKPLPKGIRWSETMLLRDSQHRRRRVLRQRWETKANWRVIIRQPETRLRKEEVGEANEIAAVSQNKEILTVIPQTPVEKQRPNEGKSLLTRDVRNFSGATKNKKTL